MNYIPQIGDIILSDSDKTGPKIVKFFMTAPTVFQHLWRKIRDTQEKVEYYHASMVINNDFNGQTNLVDIIEQQAKVQLSDWSLNKRQVIFRKKDLTIEEQRVLKEVSLKDLGRGYDVLNCFGKFLTWLTGIKLFARYLEWPKTEICINRVLSWYWKIGEKFDYQTHSEATTHTWYKKLLANSNYEIVYQKD